jgi:hypothetical protein
VGVWVSLCVFVCCRGRGGEKVPHLCGVMWSACVCVCVRVCVRKSAPVVRGMCVWVCGWARACLCVVERGELKQRPSSSLSLSLFLSLSLSLFFSLSSLSLFLALSLSVSLSLSVCVCVTLPPRARPLTLPPPGLEKEKNPCGAWCDVRVVCVGVCVKTKTTCGA